MHVYHGGLQAWRGSATSIRPASGRDCPQGVAALVDGLRDDGASLTLVNTDAAAMRAR